MKRSHTLLLSAILLATPAAFAQQTRMLTADKHNEYGLVYTLPNTGLVIDVTAVRTVRVPGPYYQYAKRFIGTDKVVSEASESWTPLEVKVYPQGVPVEEDRYLIQLKPGALTSLCVADNDMLLAINREASYEGVPEKPADIRSEVPDIKEYLQYVNEDFLASQSSASQAKMLAENLMEIRDAKVSLTRGTAETMPSDGRQLELMLKSLAHQEATMTYAFRGLEYSDTITRRYTYMPGDEEGKTVLFRLSDFAGFVEPDDYSGEPVYLDLKVTRRGEMPVDSKGEAKKLPKDAVVYNIPGAAKVKLTYGGATLWEDEMEFSQYGTQFGLQPQLFSDRKAPSAATFNPATGALVEIEDIDAE